MFAADARDCAWASFAFAKGCNRALTPGLWMTFCDDASFLAQPPLKTISTASAVKTHNLATVFTGKSQLFL